MNSCFESLKNHPRGVILDTDIGPDCDDVGALACLIHYAKTYGFPILGVCNCTSNPAGNGTVDAVCRHCGYPTPALGQWDKPGFLDSDPFCRYNKSVAEKFSDDYRTGTLKVADPVTFYRRLLADAPDHGVMIITIGMFNNLAALLDSPADHISPLTGPELIRAKVYALVSMAAILPEGREFNVFCDHVSCQQVFAKWPTPVFLSDFRIGYNMMTGFDSLTDADEAAKSPLTLAYYLYSGGMNHSFDLTAVQFAALGEGELYALHEPVELEFYAEQPDGPADATRAIPHPDGKFFFMKKVAEDEVVAESLNRILRAY